METTQTHMPHNIKYTLYKHIFPNNKIYIGVTCRKLSERWKNGSGYKTQKLMWKAIQKYKWENIKHEILLETEDKNLIEKEERRYITEVYHSNNRKFGYNIENGGNYAGKAAVSTIKKRVKKLKGQKRTLEQKQRISQAHIGIKAKEETKQKMSKIMHEKYLGKNNPMYGKKLSSEHKKKLFEAIAKTRKRKPIRCIETGEVFESIQMAANTLGLFRKASSNLIYALKKSTRTCKGYHWEYVE